MDGALLIEAYLFASAEPVPLATLQAFLDEHGDDGANLEHCLEQLSRRYADHAIELVKCGRGWQIRTRAAFAPYLRQKKLKPRRLSRSAMETLAVIAYHQPCTRAEIEAIRGVTLQQTVFDALITKGFIAPKGRKEVPGRPILWGTTTDFLTHFGLADLNALPNRNELWLENVELPDESDNEQ